LLHHQANCNVDSAATLPRSCGHSLSVVLKTAGNAMADGHRGVSFGRATGQAEVVLCRGGMPRRRF
jgi:hypothetical protein